MALLSVIVPPVDSVHVCVLYLLVFSHSAASYLRGGDQGEDTGAGSLHFFLLP